MIVPARLASALTEGIETMLGEGVAHAVVGGIASSIWGRPRSTQDVDFVVLPRDGNFDDFIAMAGERFRPGSRDFEGFCRVNRFAPVFTNSGVRIDFLFADHPFQIEAIRRRRMVSIDGMNLPLCSPEELLVFKAISDRGIDKEDVEKILVRRLPELDLERTESQIRDLAALFETPQILDDWLAAVRKAKEARSRSDFEPWGDREA